MKYCFYGKNNVDYSKYGFIFENAEWAWVLWKGTRRITIKSDNSMCFNSVTSEVLKVFMDMIKDDVVILKEHKEHKPRTRHMNLDEDEYNLILERRKENKL